MKCFQKGVGFGALVAALALSAATMGCSSTGDTGAESSTGKVSMQLTGQTNGNSYRLRNARFDVTGPQNVTLDSESNLTDATLNATLSTGTYSINLEPGWSLERNDAGTFNVVAAGLASMNPQSFQILGGGTTNVAFQFTTDGTLVTIGTGNLSVSIGVTETTTGANGAPCTLVPNSGCPAGQTCDFDPAASGLGGACRPTGTVPSQAACSDTNSCVAGDGCFETSNDPNNSMPVCFQFCDPSHPVCATGTCTSFPGFAFGACF